MSKKKPVATISVTKEPTYQVVTLTLSDGTKASFTGPAQFFPGDTRKVSAIDFSLPKPLPPGCSFGVL